MPMLRQHLIKLATLAALGLTVAACGSQAEPASQPGAPTTAAEASVAIADLPTIEAGVQPTAGMISSGTAERPTDLPAPERPTPEAGVRRAIHINEAVRVLPYTVLEPKALAEGFFLDATQLTENPEGQSLPGLPKVRMIYQGDPQGVIILVEGPATGATAEGEAVQIGAYPGWYTDSPAPILVWEQDGLRIEMRGKDVTRDLLLAAAASMAPFEIPAQ